jgi:hypothetical protein
MKMPEPVAYQWLNTAHFRKHLPKDAEHGDWNALYTADALRDVLEQAAMVCDEYAKNHAKEDDNTKAQAWMMLQCGAKIRAMKEQIK